MILFFLFISKIKCFYNKITKSIKKLKMKLEVLKDKFKAGFASIEWKSLFNKECIIFLFALYSKKLSFYISVLVFAILLAVFICIPPLNGWSSVYFFSIPITMFIFIFTVFVITSYISIEVFRGPIDDGSELLIVSKPLNRISLFFSKSLILMYYGLIMMLISFPIVSLSLLFSINDNTTSLSAIKSIPVGVFFSFIISSSISVLVSLFLKKITSLIVMICLNIFFLVFSIVCGFALDLTEKNNNQVSSNFATANILNYTTTSSGYNNIKFKNGLYNKTSNGLYKPSDFYSTVYYDTLTFPKVSSINFYSQISNIYSFNKPFKPAERNILKSGVFNYPFYLTFINDNPEVLPHGMSNETHFNIKLPASQTEEFFIDASYSNTFVKSTYEKDLYYFKKSYGDAVFYNILNLKLKDNETKLFEKYLKLSISSVYNDANSDYSFSVGKYNTAETSQIGAIIKNSAYWKYLNFFKLVDYLSNMFMSYLFNSDEYLANKEEAIKNFWIYLFTIYKSNYNKKEIDLTKIDDIVKNDKIQESDFDVIKNLIILRIFGVDFHNYFYNLGLSDEKYNISGLTESDTSKLWQYLDLSTPEKLSKNYKFMFNLQNYQPLPVTVITGNKYKHLAKVESIKDSETNKPIDDDSTTSGNDSSLGSTGDDTNSDSSLSNGATSDSINGSTGSNGEDSSTTTTPSKTIATKFSTVYQTTKTIGSTDSSNESTDGIQTGSDNSGTMGGTDGSNDSDNNDGTSGSNGTTGDETTGDNTTTTPDSGTDSGSGSTDSSSQISDSNNTAFLKYIIYDKTSQADSYQYVPFFTFNNAIIYNTSLQNYFIKSYYDTASLFLCWFFFSVFVYGVSYLVYRKKDFK